MFGVEQVDIMYVITHRALQAGFDAAGKPGAMSRENGAVIGVEPWNQSARPWNAGRGTYPA